jgi:hypothetical protein
MDLGLFVSIGGEKPAPLFEKQSRARLRQKTTGANQSAELIQGRTISPT